MKRLVTAITLLMCLCGYSLATELKPYSATYKLEHKKRRIGESLFTLRKNEDGSYSLDSKTKAKGLAKLVRARPLIENSLFRVDNGTVQSMELWSNEHSKKLELINDFDWVKKTVTVKDESDSHILNLDETPTYDRMNIQIGMMLDALTSKSVDGYHLVRDDNISLYQSEIEDHQVLNILGHDHNVVIITRRRPNSSRETITWLAKDYHYLPLKIEQRRKGERRTRMTIKSYQFSGDETTED